MEEAKKVANENFDWNAFENDLGVYDQPKEQIGEAYDKTLSNIAANEVTEGTVIGINKREVVVNIGYKSEGIIPISEFRYNPDLKVGDKIEVYVESAEDKNGQLALSHKKARQLKSWDRVNEALEKDEIIKGYIKCRTKGGMIVDVFGIEAFLPGSQIDVKPIRDYDVYVDKTMEFKVVKINQEFRNVVVSHKALIEAELEAQKQVIKPRIIRSCYGRPFEIFTDQSAIASKKPDFFTTPIKIIMPARRPMVLKSMKCRSAISCVTSPLYTTSPAPRRAHRERGILSDMKIGRAHV